MRKILTTTAAVTIVALAGAALVLNRSGDNTAGAEMVPGTPAPTSTTLQDEDDLVFSVVDTIAPSQATVAGLEDGDPARPVGRIGYPDGDTSDLVLGELIVSTDDAGALEGFLARHSGELIDSYPGGAGEPTDYLVRVPLGDVDAAAAAAALADLEPDSAGDHALSDPQLVSMLYIAATETLEHGLDVAPN